MLLSRFGTQCSTGSFCQLQWTCWYYVTRNRSWLWDFVEVPLRMLILHSFAIMYSWTCWGSLWATTKSEDLSLGDAWSRRWDCTCHSYWIHSAEIKLPVLLSLSWCSDGNGTGQPDPEVQALGLLLQSQALTSWCMRWYIWQSVLWKTMMNPGAKNLAADMKAFCWRVFWACSYLLSTVISCNVCFMERSEPVKKGYPFSSSWN